jgi:hypothetical protein
MSFNTYKLSTRDGVKYITKDGIEIASSASTTPPIDWGFEGKGTVTTARVILTHEYGENTAERYKHRFVQHALTNLPEQGRTFTSSNILMILSQIDKNEPPVQT